MFEPGSDEYVALYCDEAGELICLDEVQLLDPVPSERIHLLRSLLEHPDEYVVYQAIQVLAAWGDDHGLAAARRWIEGGVSFGGRLDPHRLHGADQVYDKLAEALAVATIDVDEAGRSELVFCAGRLLERFERHYLRDGLARLLLKLDEPRFVDDIEAAIERARECGRLDQAAKLLPPLMKLDAERGWQAIQLFDLGEEVSAHVAGSVVGAIGYARTAEGLALVEQLGQHRNPHIRRVVESALKYRWNRRSLP